MLPMSLQASTPLLPSCEGVDAPLPARVHCEAKAAAEVILGLPGCAEKPGQSQKENANSSHYHILQKMNVPDFMAPFTALMIAMALRVKLPIRAIKP